MKATSVGSQRPTSCSTTSGFATTPIGNPPRPSIQSVNGPPLFLHGLPIPGILPKGGILMGQKVELPDAVYAALQDVARVNGTTAADWIAAQLPPLRPTNGPDNQLKDDWL